MGNNLGVFEADANADKLSAEAAANNGFELEKSVDRAIFRAKERFGAYLANSESKSDLEDRWAQIKPEVIKVIAEVTTPTPGVIQRVGRALDPSLSSRAVARKTRPSSAKTASEKQLRERSHEHRDEVVPGSGRAIEPKDFTRVGATQKHAWTYDQEAKLYTSKNQMEKFACPGCGTEQDHLGFTKCTGAGCGRTWNSWPVRQASSEKTSASTYVLMAREIKMRGDQFKMAAAGNVSVAASPDGPPWIPDPAEREAMRRDLNKALAADLSKVADAPMPQEPSPGMSQPTMSGMPGDNSGAVGSPVPPAQPAVPGGDPDGDKDIAGQVTEDSPIDQIQDALQDAIVALKDVQMLSINPALAATASAKGQKVATLRTSMDRFWGLHKQMQYVAGMLAKEANEALRTVDPRITSEAEFVRGFEAAAKNEPLPPTEKTGRAYLEGYVAFHKQADSYSDGANIGGLFQPGSDDTSNGDPNGGTYLNGSGIVPANEIRSDAGPFDTSQPASSDFASDMDSDNAAGKSRGDQGESSSIQPTGARKPLPKGRR